MNEQKYVLTTKSGSRHIIGLTSKSKSPTGLWIWSTRQYNPVVLNFGKLSILSTQIESIEEMENVQ